MEWLLLAIMIEAIVFAVSAASKFSADPDMHIEGPRKRYLRTLWINFAGVVIVTVIVWWYWHPFAIFFSNENWKTYTESLRP